MMIFNSRELCNRLHEILKYDSESGLFTWKVRTSKRVRKGQIAGTVKNDGYVRIRIDGSLYLAHRLAWLYHYGEFPENEIDHINRNKSDNRISNLRDSCRVKNARNKDLQSNNTSGVIGVRWHDKSCRWQAYIGVNGKTIQLGKFEEFHEAVNARKNAEVLYGF